MVCTYYIEIIFRAFFQFPQSAILRYMLLFCRMLVLFLNLINISLDNIEILNTESILNYQAFILLYEDSRSYTELNEN